MNAAAIVRGRGRHKLAATLLAAATLVGGSGSARAVGVAPEVEVRTGAVQQGAPASGWAVALTADKSAAQTGQFVHLTATASGRVETLPGHILIYDTTNAPGVVICDQTTGTTCTSPPITQLAASIRTYTAYVADSFSATPPTSGVHARSNTVAVGWVAAPQPPVNQGPGYSNRCTSPTQTIVDGWSTNRVYERLQVQATTQSAVICFRVASADAYFGGDVEVTAPAPVLGLPVTDSNGAACGRDGNAAPVPTVVPFGILGFQGSMGVFFDYRTAEACLDFGTAQEHVVVPISNGPAPSVTVNFDNPAATSPVPVLGPAGDPSSQCQANGGLLLFDGMTAAGTRAWAFAWHKDANTVVVCARVEGLGGAAGGALTFTAPTPDPSVTLSPDVSRTVCPDQVVDVGQASIYRTPEGSDPASVCLSAADNNESITVGTGVTELPISWSQDPS